MGLVDTQTYDLKECFDDDVPPYAILSHRWSASTENLYQDYRKMRNCHGPGYEKIIRACDFARSRNRSHIWIDTCCIDKRSSAELSEAINSMYDYYVEALECYAYLIDVPASTIPRSYNAEDFRSSEWFTRGWTLQELVAPSLFLFLNADWQVFGAKGYADVLNHFFLYDKLGDDLDGIISDISGIPYEVLRHPTSARSRSIAERMSWAANRVTTRAEEQAYCLLGLFEVNMPLLYE